MKIAILTSGILPVPAVLGGAVENLIDFYLEYNNLHQLHDITVYSVWHPDTQRHPALSSSVNHYRYIDMNSRIGRFKKWLYLKQHGDEYYHYSIEYFLHTALKHIRKANYDMIVIENRPAYSLKLKETTKARIVYHLHNEKLGIHTRHAKTIFEAADKILCVSNYITNQVQAIFPEQQKCLTVHNGIDLLAFKKGRNSPVSRTAIGMEDNDFVLVFSGRINKEKGIKELIEAMARLKEHPQIKLMVIGSSFYGLSNAEDDFMQSIKKEAEQIRAHILFTGFVPYNQMPSYLQLADVAVIPSMWDDPFPTTVLEAQAMGLPIITTRRGGIPEEVTPDNAIMLETDEHFVDNLATAILNLYEHVEKRQQMAEASYEHAVRFDKSAYARRFFEALNLT